MPEFEAQPRTSNIVPGPRGLTGNRLPQQIIHTFKRKGHLKNWANFIHATVGFCVRCPLKATTVHERKKDSLSRSQTPAPFLERPGPVLIPRRIFLQLCVKPVQEISVRPSDQPCRQTLKAKRNSSRQNGWRNLFVNTSTGLKSPWP